MNIHGSKRQRASAFERRSSTLRPAPAKLGFVKPVRTFPGGIRSRIFSLAAICLSLAIAGCAVGPDFKRPAAPAVSGYRAAPLTTTVTSPNVAGGEAQRFSMGIDIPGDWWTLFHSKPLNELIERSLANNADLKAA